MRTRKLNASVRRIAISGHRWNRLDPALESALREALLSAFAELESQAPDTVTTLSCGMAEGADLVAASVLPANWNLEALLPLSVDKWRAHLATNASGDRENAVRLFDAVMARPNMSVVELPPAAGDDPDYPALATRLAQDADLLVAVWNGDEGLPGGTGEVVRKTLALEKSVLWISPEPDGFATRLLAPDAA
ncbi:MAG: hypothetical protein AB7F96_14990 [Beijerinckiaceae bacterium]